MVNLSLCTRDFMDLFVFYLGLSTNLESCLTSPEGNGFIDLNCSHLLETDKTVVYII